MELADSLRFDMNAVLERLLDEAYSLLAALPLFVLALLVVWLGWLIGGWLSRRAILDRLARRNPFMRELVGTTARWAMTIFALLVALEIMNATALVGAVLGTAGMLGVALGFAFKDTLENYLAGLLMSMRQPFAPRDHVVIDGNEGLIIALTSRATILMTLDGNHLRLPNALVFRSVTLNYTRNPSRRFQFDVGVGVEEDLICAQQIGIDKLAQVDGILTEPPPRAYIVSLGDSNVQIRFHGWVDQRTHDFLLVKSEAIRLVKLALEDAGMDLPEPIYRVQLNERPPSVGRQDQTPQRQPKSPPPNITVSVPDTRAVSDLQPQIEADQRAHGTEDLLSPAAPRE